MAEDRMVRLRSDSYGRRITGVICTRSRAWSRVFPVVSLVIRSRLGDFNHTIPTRVGMRGTLPIQGASAMKKHTKEKNHTQQKKERRQPAGLPIINPDAAGIDVGSEEHWVAVPGDRDEQPVRCFGCFTADLHEMARWLKACKVTTIAMEATGVYWITPFQVLESYGFEVKVVNARHVKNVPGRKTDVEDAQWIQRLHSCGLLAGSFRPDDNICVLRSYWRHRENMIQSASASIQHMQKALIQMNVHLHKVLSDITGVTGMRIIRSILEGERNPRTLASLSTSGVKTSRETIAKALEGDWRAEHLFVLAQALEWYEFSHRQIAACDTKIEEHLGSFQSKADPQDLPGKGNITPRKNQSHIDLRAELFRITGRDYTRIDGLDTLTVQTVVSEVGLDSSRFPTVKHFTSWLTLCPENRITGGRIKNSRTRKSANRAATAFRLAAQSLASSKTALGGFYRRLKARLGSPKAITATAHKLARIFYKLWTTGEIYEDKGAHYYEEQYKNRMLRSIKRKARDLGYDVFLQPVAGQVS